MQQLARYNTPPTKGVQMSKKRFKFSPRMERDLEHARSLYLAAAGTQYRVVAIAIEQLDARLGSIDRAVLMRHISEYSTDAADAALASHDHLITMDDQIEGAIKRIDEYLRHMRVRVPRSKSGANTRFIVALALALLKPGNQTDD